MEKQHPPTVNVYGIQLHSQVASFDHQVRLSRTITTPTMLNCDGCFLLLHILPPKVPSLDVFLNYQDLLCQDLVPLLLQEEFLLIFYKHFCVPELVICSFQNILADFV